MSDYLYATADLSLYSLLKTYARHNRQYSTEAESVLWDLIRNRRLGVSFRRQHIIGCFIADFCCLERKLIIELDGKYHSVPEQHISDKSRMEWLESRGYRVVRFMNEEVLCNIDNVLERIKETIYHYGNK